ncbi:MAG: hypothetical protein CL678_09610 [Bdellovibrionaceae bacterium]|nr:hypothetical protein [Pseudobdellovibrionaceae bacterium]|tara:strand:- start:1464 stop:2519 length:1056 start_codon:yes stop_codon:yes gene_type:complete
MESFVFFITVGLLSLSAFGTDAISVDVASVPEVAPLPLSLSDARREEEIKKIEIEKRKEQQSQIREERKKDYEARMEDDEGFFGKFEASPMVIYQSDSKKTYSGGVAGLGLERVDKNNPHAPLSKGDYVKSSVDASYGYLRSPASKEGVHVGGIDAYVDIYRALSEERNSAYGFLGRYRFRKVDLGSKERSLLLVPELGIGFLREFGETKLYVVPLRGYEDTDQKVHFGKTGLSVENKMVLMDGQMEFLADFEMALLYSGFDGAARSHSGFGKLKSYYAEVLDQDTRKDGVNGFQGRAKFDLAIHLGHHLTLHTEVHGNGHTYKEVESAESVEKNGDQFNAGAALSLKGRF